MVLPVASQPLNVPVSDVSDVHGGSNSATTYQAIGPLATGVGPKVVAVVVPIEDPLTNTL